MQRKHWFFGIADDTLILVEAKRFYDIDEAKAICNDIKRLYRFKFKKEMFYNNIQIKNTVSCILAQTNIPELAFAWSNKKARPNLRSKRYGLIFLIILQKPQ